MRLEGGETRYIRIRRLRCSSCNRLHNELPDILTPYKHYRTETIEGVIDGVVQPDDEDSEDYPCEKTMERWNDWIERNRNQIDGYLKSIAHRFFDFSEQLLKSKCSLLDKLRDQRQDWLAVINKLIYNTCGSLIP